MRKTLNFSKCYRKKCFLCTSIKWPSDLVNSASCKCSLIWCKMVCNNNIAVLIWYLMPLISYHSVPTFVNSNMLSFNTLHHMIFHWGNDIVSFSKSMSKPFFEESFPWQAAEKLLWKIYEGSSAQGTNDQIMQRGVEKSTKTFTTFTTGGLLKTS